MPGLRKLYPKKVSLGLSDKVYIRLKKQAKQEDRPMLEVIREAIKDYLTR